MVEIQIQGGDTEAAAQAMRASVQDIFGFEPIVTPRGSSDLPATRDLVALATLALTLPITALAATDLISRAKRDARVQRLTDAAVAQKKATGARLLLDPGDGTKPIPLEHANRGAILEALEAYATRRKT